jgi:hypothetical protein
MVALGMVVLGLVVLGMVKVPSSVMYYDGIFQTAPMYFFQGGFCKFSKWFHISNVFVKKHSKARQKFFLDFARHLRLNFQLNRRMFFFADWKGSGNSSAHLMKVSCYRRHLEVLVPFLERPILERPFLTRPFLERPILDAIIPNATIPRRDNS